MDSRSYRTTRILGASGLELVCIAFEGAIEAIDEARQHLAAGDVRARSRAITRSLDFVGELQASLDFSAGEVSHNLDALYRHVQAQLLAANFEQFDRKMVEARTVLSTLLSGWREIARNGTEKDAVLPQPMNTELVEAGARTAKSWSC